MLLMRHSGGQVSSLDMAQYVFWTGDEEGVARAVDEFIQKGLVNSFNDLGFTYFILFCYFFQMSRENAIKLLREISMGIEYLENSFNISVMQSTHSLNGVNENSIDRPSGSLMVYLNWFY